jgi:T-complex protein 1 subunit theta
MCLLNKEFNIINILCVYICKFEDEDTSVSTIVLRASTENVMNDLERSVDDGVCSVKTLCNDPRLLPGAGMLYY